MSHVDFVLGSSTEAHLIKYLNGDCWFRRIFNIDAHATKLNLVGCELRELKIRGEDYTARLVAEKVPRIEPGHVVDVRLVPLAPQWAAWLSLALVEEE